MIIMMMTGSPKGVRRNNKCKWPGATSMDIPKLNGVTHYYLSEDSGMVALP